MELRHLRYFAAVAAHGSFNRASQILHLTQPALSRQVKDLEEEIGVPLLVRGTNSVTLTAIGESFYEDARDLLARADKAIQRARGERSTEIVRVGYMPTSGHGIMAIALKKFQAARPRVRVELSELVPAELRKAAQEGRVDVAMLPEGHTDLLPGFQWSELRPITLMLVIPTSHPLARLKKIAPTRLRDVPLIGLGKESFPGYTSHLRACLRPFGVIPRFVALIDDGLTSVLTALEASHAAAVLGDAVESALPPTMLMRPFSPALPMGRVMIGVPEDQPNLHAEEFAKLLREQTEHLRRASKS
jgi:LysR family hca operon transcriptional activator